MKDFIQFSILALPALYFLHRAIEFKAISNLRKSDKFEIIVWDDLDEFYVVADKVTDKQYIVDRAITGIKLSETVIDWRR